MKYDFETVHDRYDDGSIKWLEVEDTLGKRPKDVVPFTVADMEFPTCPDIVSGVKNVLDNQVIGYNNPTPRYYDAVLGWMRDHHNWNAKKEWIVNTDGIVHAFHLAVKAFTKPGEGVMLMTPVYYPMYHAIRINNRKLVESPLIDAGDHFEIDCDDFEKKAKDPNTKLFIFCSPHNPGTRLWTKEEQERIAKICLENNVIVCADEIHNDLVMPGYKHVMYPTISKEAEQNSIIMTAPSKAFNLAGFQTSNIFIPNEKLRQKFLDVMHTDQAVYRCNYLGYVACYLAYTQGAEWLNQCIHVIDHNRQVVTDFMHENFPQIKIYRMEATYLLWMNWKGLDIPADKLKEINRKEAGLFFDEGPTFGKAGEGFERWNLAAPTWVVKAGLERMKKAYSKYLK